jgi:hypothetical protein
MIAQRSSHGAGRAIKRRIRSQWAGQPIGVSMTELFWASIKRRRAS